MSETTNTAEIQVQGQLAIEAEGMAEAAEPQKVQLKDVSLDELLTESEYSGYGIHTVLNKIFEAVGVEKIRPQMIYNYARNGMVVPGESVAKGTYVARKYTKDEVALFVAKFAPRHVARNS